MPPRRKRPKGSPQASQGNKKRTTRSIGKAAMERRKKIRIAEEKKKRKK
jgi:hypothetical protein